MTDEPHVRVNVDKGQSYEINRNNATLYTYVGELTSRSHVLVYELDKIKKGYKVRYIFSLNPGYQQIADYMINNGFQCQLDMTDISDEKEEAFQGMIADAVAQHPIPDSLPADFS